MFEAAYAHANSENARICGEEINGCWVVARLADTPEAPRYCSPELATRQAFASKDAAQAWIEEHAVA